MRIAYCISGQIRTGIDSFPYIMDFIDSNLLSVDFFIHTWDVNSISLWEPKWTDEYEPRENFKVEISKLEMISKLYNPKKMVVSNFDEYQRNVTIKFIPFSVPLYQSAYECNKLKIEYEVENDFKYDYVIKSRFDCIFNLNHKLIDELLYISGSNRKEIYTNDYWNKLPYYMEDIFWVGKSEYMDSVCDFINYTPCKYSNIDRQEQMYFYITENFDMIIRPMLYNELTILRQYNLNKKI